jgi:uridine kinase
MNQDYSIEIDDSEYKFPPSATFGDAAAFAAGKPNCPALGAIMNNQIYSLAEKLPGSGSVSFIDITHEEGSRIYARSASFLLVRAVRELYQGARVVIDYSINQSLYCEVKWDRRITPVDLKAIESRMHAIVAADEPFMPVQMPAQEARALLEADGRGEAAALLRQEDGVFSGYRFGGFLDTWYGPLVPSAGFLKLFRLHHYLPGFLLMIPNSYSPGRIPAFAELPKLSSVFNESADWERLIGVTCMADLNRSIRSGYGRELVRMCEAWHDKKIAGIADMISREKRRVILIAGPSSSGKTTFAQRLTVHLHACGLQPLALSLDDYYLDRDICPKDENGKYDLESIDALDVPLFEEQITALLAGESVELAKFDFKTQRCTRSGQRIAVKADQPLIIEGINGLNERLTRFIPVSTKFRIFVSALTQLNIDDHNRVATTDVRLIRRLVRDHLFRGHSAEKTIESWPTVHGAEFKNIFPHQENADVIFSSALIYELAALRTVALPLLEAIPGDHPSRMEADRLTAFLSLVEPLPCQDEIPPISIIREFIGGCTFYI